jgi:hypothetical protein
MTGLEQFHQGKGDDKANRSPFEASQSKVEHPGQMVAQATGSLKPPCCSLPYRRARTSDARAARSFIRTHHGQLGNTIRAA